MTRLEQRAHHRTRAARQPWDLRPIPAAQGPMAGRASRRYARTDRSARRTSMRVRGHITIAVAAAAMLLSTTTAQAQGAKAAAVSLDVLTLHGTVGEIDRSDGTVALVGPEGGVLVMAVRDRPKLDAVQVGDPVQITYTRALAIALDKRAN